MRELVSNRIVTVSFVRTAHMVADVMAKALGPDKFYRFMGVILGLVRDDGLTSVQVTQAFRACDPQPWNGKTARATPAFGQVAEGGQSLSTESKTIRDSPSLGRCAEKNGQSLSTESKTIRDSPSLGRCAEKSGQSLSTDGKTIREPVDATLG